MRAAFRTIGKPYARILEGASTSGWQSLALILRNPDSFGGAFILQPDPIDFRSYQLTDIYEDENAFTTRRGELLIERPFRRTTTSFLNLAVYRFEEFLESTTNPSSDATFTYGRPMKGHSWHAWTWAEFVRQAADQTRGRAPAGENVEAWWD